MTYSRVVSVESIRLGQARQVRCQYGVTSQRPLFSIRIVTMYWKGAVFDTVALTVCKIPAASNPIVCEATRTAIKRTSLMILLLRVFPVFIAHPGSSRVLIRPNRVRQRIQDSSVSERMGMEEMGMGSERCS